MHCLSCCAFHEVINGSDNDEGVCPGIHSKPNVTEIGPADVFHIRVFAFCKHSYKRLFLIKLFICSEDFFSFDVLFKPCIDGC